MSETTPPARLPPKALLLFILPLPLLAVLLAALVAGELGRLFVSAAALALYFGAGALMRRGMLDELAMNERRYAVDAPVPRKLLAALMAGAGTCLASQFLTAQSWFETLGYSLGTIAGAVLLYGLDPRRKTGSGAELEIARALAVAEQKILDIEAANSDIGCPELSERLDRISAKARTILDLLHQKPQAIGDARRFLSSYLEGAERVARGYAKTQRQLGSDELESNFRNVLVTIETVFGEQHQKLLEDEVMDLDVQIEVLTTQMNREGVA